MGWKAWASATAGMIATYLRDNSVSLEHGDRILALGPRQQWCHLLFAMWAPCEASITNLLRAVFLADVCSMVVRACVGSRWVNAELREFCDGSCDVLRTLPTLVQQGVKSLGNFTSITLPFISQCFEVFRLVGE